MFFGLLVYRMWVKIEKLRLYLQRLRFEVKIKIGPFGQFRAKYLNNCSQFFLHTSWSSCFERKKKKKIGLNPFYGYFSPDPNFLIKGGSRLHMRLRVFSRYQFEILTHFSLSKNIYKKNWNWKKMGCGHFG